MYKCLDVLIRNYAFDLQEEIQQTHSLVSQEEEKYMNMLINFWQKANSHSITHLTDDEYLKGVKSYIDSYKS